MQANFQKLRWVARNVTQTATFVWNHPANRNRQVRALARLICWQIWERLVGMPWTVEVGRAESGLRMRVYPHSTGATGALYCRLPDYEEMSFVLDYLHGGDTFVDVGANVGSYTLLAASVPGTQVVAFEPASIAAGRLRENVALNALGGRVRVAQMAVGAQAGAARLTVGLDCINKLVEPSHCGEAEAVVVTTLDEALASQDAVSVVKIDVEGAEEQVLIGGGAHDHYGSAGPYHRTQRHCGARSVPRKPWLHGVRV